ncbi:MAG: hypothetical protein WBQ14_00485 [Gaiellaceae bacterium]
MSRIVVNPRDLRATAKFMNTAWCELRPIPSYVDGGDRPEMPPPIAAEFQAVNDYCGAVIRESLNELESIFGELHRRALWAELVSAYEHHFDAPFTLTALRHLNELLREKEAMHWATPVGERGEDVDSIEEDDLFFDIVTLPVGGVLRLFGKKGAKKLIKQVAKIFARDAAEGGFDKVVREGVESLVLDSHITREIAGDVGDSTPMEYGNRVHRALQKLAREEDSSWIPEYRIKGIGRADLVKGIGRADQASMVNFRTGTIIEIKPYNPRQIKKGLKQLSRYKSALENRWPDIEWKTQLITYVRP